MMWYLDRLLPCAIIFTLFLPAQRIVRLTAPQAFAPDAAKCKQSSSIAPMIADIEAAFSRSAQDG